MALNDFDVIKSGYVKIRSKPYSTPRWKKRFIVFRRCSSRGPVRFEVYRDRRSAVASCTEDVKLYELIGMKSLVRETREAVDGDRFILTMEYANKLTVFTVDSESEMDDWYTLLENTCLSDPRPTFINKDESNYLSFSSTWESFHVHLCRTSAIVFEGECILQLSHTKVRLIDAISFNQIVIWTLDTLRKFGCENNQLFLETGRSSTTGEGVFIFQTWEASLIRRCLNAMTKLLQEYTASMPTGLERSRSPSNFKFVITQQSEPVHSSTQRVNQQKLTHSESAPEQNVTAQEQPSPSCCEYLQYTAWNNNHHEPPTKRGPLPEISEKFFPHTRKRADSELTSKRTPLEASVLCETLYPPSPTDSFGSGPLRPLPPLPCALQGISNSRLIPSSPLSKAPCCTKNEVTPRLDRSVSPRPPLPPFPHSKPSVASKSEIPTIPGIPSSLAKVAQAVQKGATPSRTPNAATHSYDIPPSIQSPPPVYNVLFDHLPQRINNAKPKANQMPLLPPPRFRNLKSRGDTMYSSLVDLQSVNTLKCATIHNSKDSRMYSSSESLLSDSAKCARRKLEDRAGDVISRGEKMCNETGARGATFLLSKSDDDDDDDDDEEAYQGSDTYYSTWHVRSNTKM